MLNLEKTLIPKPKRIRCTGVSIKIADFNSVGVKILSESDDARVIEGARLIRERLFDIAAIDGEGAGYTVRIIVDGENEKLACFDNGEAYYIEVSENGALLCGKEPAGALYAAVTFCDMLYTEGSAVYVEKAEIIDRPDFPRRGHFIECRYGTEFLTLKDWCDFIDYLVKMKINTLTVGVYGCWRVQYDTRRMEYLYVPIKSHPELKTLKNIKYYSVKDKKWVHKDNIVPFMYEEDFLGDIIAYGKRKNVLVKPLFNSLGHNTLLPRMIPEISAKREDGTPTEEGFCTRNEKTYEVMEGIYDEIIDRYLLPNGIYDIQIGLDEVGPNYICHCEKCKDSTHAELMVEYIIRLCKYLKSRGMKHIYIYHDMLYHNFNIINEDLRDRFIDEGIYDEVVIDWWSYEDPKHLFWDKPDGVNNLFHSVIKPDTGYYHWSIPTENNENIRAMAKKARDLAFEGIESYSSLEYCYDKNYSTVADVAWNNAGIEDREEFDKRYAYRHYPNNAEAAKAAFDRLFDVMRDETTRHYINRMCRFFDYYFYCYRNPDLSLKSFPGGAYKLISDDEDTYIGYFKYVKENAEPAFEFFKHSGDNSAFNSIWQLTAMQYCYMADEYLTIWQLYKSYNSGLVDAAEVINTLEGLIVKREELMLMAENVRIPANAYTYLRNMSVFRQYMLDLLNYFKRELALGNKPRLDVLDWSYVESSEAVFLR